MSLPGAAGAASAAALALNNVSNSAMQQSEDRLLTFVNWPSRIPVRPEQLAKAGFYYVGKRRVEDVSVNSEYHLFTTKHKCIDIRFIYLSFGFLRSQ